MKLRGDYLDDYEHGHEKFDVWRPWWEDIGWDRETEIGYHNDDRLPIECPGCGDEIEELWGYPLSRDDDRITGPAGAKTCPECGYIFETY
jgi:hypothetical protein